MLCNHLFPSFFGVVLALVTTSVVGEGQQNINDPCSTKTSGRAEQTLITDVLERINVWELIEEVSSTMSKPGAPTGTARGVRLTLGAAMELAAPAELLPIRRDFQARTAEEMLTSQATEVLSQIEFRRGRFCESARLLTGDRSTTSSDLLRAYLAIIDGDLAAAERMAELHVIATSDPGESSSNAWKQLAATLEVLKSGGQISTRLRQLAYAQKPPNNIEAKAVQEDAKLTLATALLRTGKLPESAGLSGSIELGSRESGRALLVAGWTQMEAGQPTKALVYWRELAARQGDDSEVFEARALIPRALWAAGGRAAAARAYEENANYFSSEVQRIALTIVAIERGKLEDELLKLNRCTDCSWLDDIDAPSVWPYRSLLARVIAQNRFQEAFRELRATVALSDRLDDLEEDGIFVPNTSKPGPGAETQLGITAPERQPILDLRGTIDRLVATHRSQIRGMAVAALHAQQARLEDHIEQSLLAVAQIHDILATQVHAGSPASLSKP